MELTSGHTYRGHQLRASADTAATGWWQVPELKLQLKTHQQWRAEIWQEPDVLTLARLRIYNTRSGAEWLDASCPRGTRETAPYERAETFMVDGVLSGWGEWPSEPTSSGRVPMAKCHYCAGPVSFCELLVINTRGVGPELSAWEPRAHQSCHRARQAERAEQVDRTAPTRTGQEPCR